MLISLFLVYFSFTFLFIPCGRLSWLSVSFFLHLRPTNALNIPTKFLQPVNLAILTIWSLFNPLAPPAPHLLSLFLDHQTSHWKSQIARSDMPVCGINSLIHSVSLASHVSTHLLIHLSAYLCHHHHSHHPLLPHSFTPGSKPTFSTNPSHLNTSATPRLLLRLWDWTRLIMLVDLFLVRFFFNFSVCSVWWTKLSTHQLFTAR